MKAGYSLLILMFIATLALTGCGQNGSGAQGSSSAATPPAASGGNSAAAADNTATGSNTNVTGQGTQASPSATSAPAASQQAPSPITTLENLPAMVADEKIEIKGKTKSGNRIFIEGQEAPLNPNGEFDLPFTLEVGKNTIQVVTLGKDKVEDTQTINIERRPTPPLLTVVPPDHSDSEYITITGQTEKDCIVYINSNTVTADRLGNFSSAVQLKEGVNTIRITSTNRDGGTAVVEKKVIFTPPDPRLEVIIPPSSSSSQVTISGITDTNTVLVLYVNDARSTIDQQNGIFSSTITLQDGDNNVTVVAINKWGKKTTVTKNISYSSP